MTHPSRPTYQQQGPATNCVIDGRALGWYSCTAYSMAMLIDRSTLGIKRPSGCAVRRPTGDTTGGLTLIQVSSIAEQMGVHIELHLGSNVAAPSYLARQIRAGRGAVVQGNTGALVRTTFRSTGGPVNHAVVVNEVRGGTIDKPDEGLVYDPAADGRGSAWGTADQGPSWWPWSLVLAFAAALRPWGDNDSRTLGPGKVYCGIGPDTEPHMHRRFSSRKSKPFPDRTRFADNDGWVHSKPDASAATRIRRTSKGRLFVVYQVAKGPDFQGSTLWGGNHDGTEWVARKRLEHWEGGT